MGSARRRVTIGAVATAALAGIAVAATGALSSSIASASARAFSATVFANAARIEHAAPKGREAISQPDDITSLGGHIFVGFQNGVGPQGQASPTGNSDSTVVEFDLSGHAVAQWDITGKCDGLTADPQLGRVIATVDEDANSSLYLIDPSAGSTPVHYHYNEPLPSNGGTDAISVYRGMILISASAPGTKGAAAPQASYPAVYRTTLDAKTAVATVSPLFSDEAKARVANTGADAGRTVSLALTDPDSNEVVPSGAPRFAGQFMLTSQGDKEQIFVSDAGGAGQSLSVLRLSDSVDDTAWPTSPSGAIYTTDNDNDTVYRITGPFVSGSVFVAVTPCDANGAPSTCPGPGYPANYLGELDTSTGAIARCRSARPRGGDSGHAVPALSARGCPQGRRLLVCAVAQERRVTEWTGKV